MRAASDPVAGTVEGEGVGAPIAPRRVERGTVNDEASEEHRIARRGLDRGGREAVDVPFEPDAKRSGIQPRMIDGALQVTPVDEANASIAKIRGVDRQHAIQLGGLFALRSPVAPILVPGSEAAVVCRLHEQL